MNEVEFLRAQIRLEQHNLAKVLEHCRAWQGAPSATGLLAGNPEGCARYLLYAGQRTLRQDRRHCEQLSAQADGRSAPQLDPGVVAGLAATLPLRQQLLQQLDRNLRDFNPASSDPALLCAELGRQAALLLGASLPERWAALQQLLEEGCSIAHWREAAMVDAESIFEERRLFAGTGLTPP